MPHLLATDISLPIHHYVTAGEYCEFLNTLTSNNRKRQVNKGGS